jgi:hypothetical protein
MKELRKEFIYAKEKERKAPERSRRKRRKNV